MDHGAILTAVEYGSVDGKRDGKAHGTRRRNGLLKLFTHTQPSMLHLAWSGHAKTYNYGHLEMSHCPKAAVPYHSKLLPIVSTTERGHRPRSPCWREVRTEVQHATIPIGVQTVDGTPVCNAHEARRGNGQPGPPSRTQLLTSQHVRT